MMRSTYGGVLEPWKVRLIERRARRWGFRGADLEDALQQIALELLSFQYDAAHSAGAAESTVLTALVDRQLATLRRAATRRQRQAEQRQSTVKLEFEETPALALSLDVEQVMATLPTLARRICLGLQAGQSLNSLATELGISWHKAQTQLQRIRQCFEEAGLGCPPAQESNEGAAA